MFKSFYIRNSQSNTFSQHFFCYYGQCLFITLFLLSSCNLETTKNLNDSSSSLSSFENTYFSNTEKDYLYKAKIAAFGNDFGGILVIKKLQEAHHRIVFTTEFGAKIFDFELEATDFKVNYIIEALDRKLLIKTLKKDFELLIKEKLSVDKSFENADYKVYQSKWNKRLHFYFFSKKNGELDKLVQTTRFKEKVLIEFKNNAKEILIQHQNMPLKIELDGF